MRNPGLGTNRLTWKLPDVIDPPDTICVTIRIPNDKLHIEAFKGAMFDLSYWWNWERDDAHTATYVAQVWRKIFYAMIFDQCAAGIDIFEEDSDTMTAFRMDCNGNLFVTDCNGVEHCVAYCDQIPASATNGSTSGGTPPPGTSAQTCFTLITYKNYLLPMVVNTGDQITLDSCKGFAWDGTEGAPLGVWRYGSNGDQSFGGVDVGFSKTVVTDPVNTSPHMSIVAAIGTVPAYIHLSVGVLTSVPSVPANSQVLIQVNTQTPGNCSGSEDLCVTVKNNSAAIWQHTFDFTVSPGGWSAFPGVPDVFWGAGHGWGNNCVSGGCINQTDIKSPVKASTAFTRIEIFTNPAFTGLHPHMFVYNSTGVLQIDGGAGVAYYSLALSLTDTSLEVDAEPEQGGNTTPGFSYITKIILHGTGSDPY